MNKLEQDLVMWDMEKAMMTANKNVPAVILNMYNAIDPFIRAGKVSYEDFANDVLKYMMKHKDAKSRKSMVKNMCDALVEKYTKVEDEDGDKE